MSTLIITAYAVIVINISVKHQT